MLDRSALLVPKDSTNREEHVPHASTTALVAPIDSPAFNVPADSSSSEEAAEELPEEEFRQRLTNW